MKLRPYLLKFITMLLLTTSCKYTNMNSLTIIDYRPNTNSINVDDFDHCYIAFSTDVNKKLAESSFRLEENGEALTGTIDWDTERSFRFIPETKISRTHNYTMHVTRIAEDLEGNSLDKDFLFTFRGNDDTTRPSIISITPTDKEIISTQRPTITILFSEPIDITSAINGITFQPNIEGYFVENNSLTSISYIITKDLLWQNKYCTHLSETICDINGNTLGDSNKFYFTVGNDDTAPFITSIKTSEPSEILLFDISSSPSITEGIDTKPTFIYHFSEPMNTTSRDIDLTFTPTVRYTTSWNADNTQLSITTSDTLIFGSLYTVTLQPSITDLQGNHLTKKQLISFISNGTNSMPPKIIRLDFTNTFLDNKPVNPLITLQPMSSIMFHEAVCTAPQIGFIDLYITTAPNAIVDYLSLLSSFSISAEKASITPIAVQANSNLAYCKDSIPPVLLPNTTCARIILEINNSGLTYNSSPGRIKIIIDPTLQDSNGNSLESPYYLDFYSTN